MLHPADSHPVEGAGLVLIIAFTIEDVFVVGWIQWDYNETSLYLQLGRHPGKQ